MDDNWVEQRFARDEALRSKAPALWQKLRAAIQDACESFNRRYALDADARAEVMLENGNRLSVTRNAAVKACNRRSIERATIVVAFDELRRRITISGFGRPRALDIECGEGGEVGILHDRGLVSVDEASKIIIEPLLFPAE